MLLYTICKSFIFIKFQYLFNEVQIKMFLNEIFNFIFHKTPLSIAIEKSNIEIIQILLLNPKIDINTKLIINIMF